MEKSKTYIKWSYLIIVVACLLLLQTEIQAQTNQFVLCQDQQMWLVNNSTAASIGKCETKNWIVSLKFVQSKSETQSKRERQVTSQINQLSKENFKPLAIEETVIKDVIKECQNKSGEITLVSSQMPEYIQSFFNKEGQKEMEFIILIGALIIDDNEDEGIFEEYSRYSIKVKGANPTIAEILNEAREKYPDKTVQTDNLQLAFPTKRELLETSKKASDYNLKDGVKFRLKSSVR